MLVSIKKLQGRDYRWCITGWMGSLQLAELGISGPFTRELRLEQI